MKDGYTLTQILLHWLIAILVPIQYLTGGSIERTHHAVHLGLSPDPWDMFQHGVHVYTGMAIGALMGIRFLVRLISGPSHSGQKGPFPTVARLLHLGFYAAIIGQAAMGFVASYLWFGIAPYHVIGSWIILGMLFLHVSAAAWHTLVMKDDTLDRMTVTRGTKKPAHEA
jgi:cytochrome b561